MTDSLVLFALLIALCKFGLNVLAAFALAFIVELVWVWCCGFVEGWTGAAR